MNYAFTSSIEQSLTSGDLYNVYHTVIGLTSDQIERLSPSTINATLNNLASRSLGPYVAGISSAEASELIANIFLSKLKKDTTSKSHNYYVITQ